MKELVTHFLTCFMGFFAIMNPIANTAAFVGLTGDISSKDKRRIAFKSLFITFCIIVVFSVLGNVIFQLFGITIEALRIAGGILLFIIGFHMLQGDSSSMHQASGKVDMSIAISPLAVPMLAGPGTIATAMNYAVSGDINKILLTLATFFTLCVVTYICFILGERLIRMIGQGGLTIITRLMCLIIAVIGVEMLISGLIVVIKTQFM